MNVQTELAHAHSELIICHSKNTSLDGSQLIISTSVPFFFCLFYFTSSEELQRNSYKHKYKLRKYNTIQYNTIPQHTIPYHTIPYNTRLSLKKLIEKKMFDYNLQCPKCILHLKSKKVAFSSMAFKD